MALLADRDLPLLTQNSQHKSFQSNPTPPLGLDAGRTRPRPWPLHHPKRTQFTPPIQAVALASRDELEAGRRRGEERSQHRKFSGSSPRPGGSVPPSRAAAGRVFYPIGSSPGGVGEHTISPTRSESRPIGRPESEKGSADESLPRTARRAEGRARPRSARRRLAPLPRVERLAERRDASSAGPGGSSTRPIRSSGRAISPESGLGGRRCRGRLLPFFGV